MTNIQLLYDDEHMETINGFPCMFKYNPADNNKPLILFIPGNSHLARIAYGSPNTSPEDFLAHWINQQGYPFLAVSYPLGNPLFPTTHPDYCIKDWCHTNITLAKKIITENQLTQRIVVVGWSMAGELTQRIYSTTLEAGLDLSLFVGLSAEPLLYNLIPDKPFLTNLQLADSGLVNTSLFFHLFADMIEYQNQLHGHTILSIEEYLDTFIGNCPLNIIGTALRFKNGAVQYDLADAIADTSALHVNQYPAFASMHGHVDLDCGFVASSQQDWGSIIKRHYWQSFRDHIQEGSPIYNKANDLLDSRMSKLFRVVDGNHFFFIGEHGAETTAQYITDFIDIHHNIALNLSHLK